MKKLTYLFSAVALLCGCEQTDVIEQHNQGSTTSGDLPEVIYATVADNNDESDKTRTVVAEDGKSILWNTGDAVAYIGPDALRAMYQYEGYDRVATAAFTYKETSSNVPEGAIMPAIPYAVYPYSSGAYCKSANTLVVDFPAEQTYALSSFGHGANVMVGVGKTAGDTDFYFRNACGYLVIKLKGEGVTVKSITLTALGGEKIAGTGLITASYSAAPTVAMTDEATSSITLNCGEGVALSADATEFWFAMPPVTFEQGFKIHVAPTSGLAFEMQTSKQVKITRNDIQPMAALQYTPNVQTSHQLFYTRKDGNTTPLEQFKVGQNTYFDATITAHYYDNKIGQHVIEFNAPLKVIKENAFKGNDIIAVSLPEQLTTIRNSAFRNTAIQELVIPGSVTLIEDYALSYIYTLKRISFLEGNEPLEIRFRNDVCTVTTHDEYAPFHKSALTYIYLNRNINYTDSDGNERFYKSTAGACHGLFRRFNVERDPCELVIGPEVTEILPMMFQECPIVHLVIPGTVNTVRHDAFCKMYDLETVTFLPSPTGTPLEMDGETDSDLTELSAFYLCDKLRSVAIDREINYINDDITAGEGIFDAKVMLAELTLGEQVKSLTDYMFYNCDALTSVTFPTSLISIGNSAFENCDGITSVNVPTSVTTMGNNVFKNSDGITSATLGAQTIGTGVLYDCDELETVTIKGTVNTIGNDAFYSCGAIKNVTLEESTTGSTLTLGYQTYGTGEEGPFYDSNLETVVWRRNISYTLANRGSADQTDEGIFSQNSALTSVTIGDQVKSIPPYTFAASGLSGSVWIPHTVESIGDKAFYDCDKLGGLTLGYDGTTTFPSIGTDVFNSCGNFTYIKVRNRVHEQFESAAKNNTSGWGAYGDYLRWADDFE